MTSNLNIITLDAYDKVVRKIILGFFININQFYTSWGYLDLLSKTYTTYVMSTNFQGPVHKSSG